MSKTPAEKGGAGGVTNPPLTPTLFPSGFLGISFEDDVTVILRICFYSVPYKQELARQIVRLIELYVSNTLANLKKLLHCWHSVCNIRQTNNVCDYNY